MTLQANKKRLSKAKVDKQPSRSSKATKTTKKVPHSKTKPVCSKFFQSSQDTPSTSATKVRNSKSGKSSKNSSATKRTKTKDKSPENGTRTEKMPKQSTPSGPRPKNRQQRKCASKVKPIIELSGSEGESSDDEYEAVESDSDSDYKESAEVMKSVKRGKKQSSAVCKKRTKTLSDESDSDYDEEINAADLKQSAKLSRTQIKQGKDTISEDKISKRQTKKEKGDKNSGGDSSVEELNSDSDFEVEVIKVASGPRKSTSSSGESSAKKKSKKALSSESDESVEIIKTKGDLDQQGRCLWNGSKFVKFMGSIKCLQSEQYYFI